MVSSSRASPPFQRKGEHRHRKARRAEAALRGVGIDQSLLHRMERAVRLRQTLDRDHRQGVDLRHQHETGIDGAVGHAPVILRQTDHHGAGAAIAFGAAFLGAGQMRVQPQIIQQRHGRRNAVLRAPAAVQLEANA